MTSPIKGQGRGAFSNPPNRYDSQRTEAFDDGWHSDEPDGRPATTLEAHVSASALTENHSPDVPFDVSINPYRGCEHGCIYCYARPSHAWMGFSPGLEFETHLVYRPDIVERLRADLGKRTYRCRPIALGSNTDVYQPVERELGLTRKVLETLLAHRHPVQILTKSALIERDLDLLGEMASQRLVSVAISVTTLDRRLARRMEPRAAAPQRRLETLAHLNEAGVPTGILVAPVIPVLTDPELETLLDAGRQAGARWARYVLLRLPMEVGPLFAEWLGEHCSESQARHVMNRIRDCHEGEVYDLRFGQRMRGSGVFADLIAKRFKLAVNKLGFEDSDEALNRADFRPDPEAPLQGELF